VLGALKFAFYAHHSSPLVTKKLVTMADLAQEYQYIAEYLTKSPIGRNVVLSANNAVITDQDLLLALLKHGGWAVFPVHFVNKNAARQLTKLNIEFLTDTGSWAYEVLTLEGNAVGPVSSLIKAELNKVFRTYVKDN
jgi:hypothetical protein